MIGNNNNNNNIIIIIIIIITDESGYTDGPIIILIRYTYYVSI